MPPLEDELRRLSLQAMILTIAIRRRMIPFSAFETISEEASKYFEDNSGSIAAAWLAFEAAEKAREATQKNLPDKNPPCVEVDIDKRFGLTNTGAMILLRDKKSDSTIPIFVGPLEANAIFIELEGIAPPRPLAPDLLKNILIDNFSALVTKAVITKCEGNVFYATLHMEKDGQEMIQDSRPSDAIAIALRFGAPIFVVERLWMEMLESENTKQLLAMFEKLCRKQDE